MAYMAGSSTKTSRIGVRWRKAVSFLSCSAIMRWKEEVVLGWLAQAQIDCNCTLSWPSLLQSCFSDLTHTSERDLQWHREHVQFWDEVGMRLCSCCSIPAQIRRQLQIPAIWVRPRDFHFGQSSFCVLKTCLRSAISQPIPHHHIKHVLI